MWVDYKPVDLEIDAVIFHVFELRRGMNEFGHRNFLSPLRAVFK